MLDFSLVLHRLVVAIYTPVRFIQYYQLVAPWRQRHLLLRKTLDSVSHHIDPSLVAGIQFQYGLLVCVTQQSTRKTQDRGCLANTWHPRDNEMGHVSIFCNNFESFNSLRVTHDIVEIDRSIFLYPVCELVI